MGKIKQNAIAEFSDELILSEVQHLAHLGFFLLEWPSGSIEFSEEAKRILEFETGSASISTESFLESIHEADAILFRNALEDSIKNISQFDIEIEVLTGSKNQKFIHSICHPVSDHRGKYKIFGTLLDITERKQTERALIEEKERTKMILDTCASFILVIGADKKVKLVNRTGCRILGLPEEEIIGKNWFANFIPRNQRKTLRMVFNEWMTSDSFRGEFHENEIITSGGKDKKWIEWHNTLIMDEEELPEGLLSSGIDITERKKAEKIRMEAVIEGEERERQRVARELHDGLMQVLSAISLNLKAFENESGQLPDVKKKAYQNALQLVDSAISDTRNISHRMMPRDLEHFGLVDAVINLCEKINQSSTLRIEFSYKGNRKKLEKRFEVILFRISQELINNILRHSKASEARIAFHQKKNKFLIQVSDNGVGFVAKKKGKEPDGIGLQNIATRVRSFNGTLLINAGKGKGTSVRIMIPLE